MYKLTLKIDKANTPKEVAAQLAKLAVWVDGGVTRGTITGLDDGSNSRITGKWNLSKDGEDDSGAPATEAP